jgi:hypothetical protein
MGCVTREPEHPPAPDEPGATDEPHDVLAADEFPGPSREAAIHERPVELPPEPDPSSEPHDVLAAEEFAMPAPRPGHELPPGATAGAAADGGGRSKLQLLAGALAAGGAAFAVLKRLRAKRASKAERVRRRITRS